MKLKCSHYSANTAIKTIKNGGVVIFPTDTVYGIGCDPYNKSSIQRIFKIKKRESEKKLPVLGYSKKTLDEIVIFDENSEKLAQQFWPGPLTLILKIKDEQIKKSMGLKEKIAVRVPNNKWALEILKKCNLLIGTSANISGRKPVNDPKKISEEIDYDILLDGGIIASKGESTIIEFKNGEMIIHREGVLTRKDILQLL